MGMETKTIKIRKKYLNEVTTKRGGKIEMLKLLAEDSNYYSLFKPSEEAKSIEEGDTVEVTVEESDRKGKGGESYYNVKQIGKKPSADGDRQKAEGTAEGGKASVTLYIDEAMEKALQERAKRRLLKAKAIVDEVFGEQDYSLYANLIAEVCHQLYGEEAKAQPQRAA